MLVWRNCVNCMIGVIVMCGDVCGVGVFWKIISSRVN